MPRPLVVVTEPEYLGAAVPILERRCRVRIGRLGRADLLRAVAGAEGLVIRIETRVDAEVLRRAPRLKVVGSATTGLDHIDLAACRRRGVRIVSLHGRHTEPTAEHAVALLLALARNVPAAASSMARGAWDRHLFIGTGLAGKTLGIVGLGRIGRRVARKAIGLGMGVAWYDPYVRRGPGRRVRSLETLLRISDAVSIHAALTNETRGMLGARALGRVRPGTLLVNVARGEIAPWRAVVAALEANRLGGAAIDVFDEEPLPAAHPLRAFARRHPERLILTPHLGASTREAADGSAREIARGVLAALEGQ